MKKWWQEEHLAAQARPPHFLSTAALLGGAGALASGGCAIIELRDEMTVEMDAQVLQQRQGWNVGQADAGPEIEGATGIDVDGGSGWRALAGSLPEAMAPAQAQLAPFYTPTLFQALVHPLNAELRAAMTPMITEPMRRAFARGEALGELFGEAGWPTDTAIVIDLPGPEAVAMAAAMAGHFEPVFTFDNWPHPAGVVPSQETLAATLFYAPLLVRARQTRPQPAAPVFVLDRARLSPYTDEQDRFDNRYWAKLPTAENLRALGIQHVLYVDPGGGDNQELDDLNEDFNAFAQAGIDVKALALTDFADAPEVQTAYVGGLGWGWAFPFRRPCWFGGSLWWHRCFWQLYGWHCPPGRPLIAAVPSHLSGGCRYHPVLRATLFTGAPPRGTPARALWRPASLGRVQARASRWDGHLTGVRIGRGFASYGRSGSLGRMGGHGSTS
jgi:hypothetical protein